MDKIKIKKFVLKTFSLILLGALSYFLVIEDYYIAFNFFLCFGYTLLVLGGVLQEELVNETLKSANKLRNSANTLVKLAYLLEGYGKFPEATTEGEILYKTALIRKKELLERGSYELIPALQEDIDKYYKQYKEECLLRHKEELLSEEEMPRTQDL
jgi:hypothetical protein